MRPVSRGIAVAEIALVGLRRDGLVELADREPNVAGLAPKGWVISALLLGIAATFLAGAEATTEGRR